MAPGDVPGRGGFQVPQPGHPHSPIVARILDAVREAKAKLQPARLGFGTGLSYLNVNRDAIDSETHLWTQAPHLNGPSDKTVAVLKFETPEDQPIVAYIDYAMQPVNGWLAGFMSADFPELPHGTWSKRITATWSRSSSKEHPAIKIRCICGRERFRPHLLTRNPNPLPVRPDRCIRSRRSGVLSRRRLRSHASVARVAQAHGVNANQVFSW